MKLHKKEIIAMLLAGGQGSRLGILTNSLAKPAIPYGGKYRIIDFPLSNCVNSGIDTIGVLTQYLPLELTTYIGSGQPWDLDRLYGGITILPPYVKGTAGEWYKGTANSIYQNMHYIDVYDPEYVLILSGDHVYKMNYSFMLDYHIQKGADCTIAVINVPIEEASRFGVMSTDENCKIYDFEEKPEHPKSTLASMGVYIFTWDKLREYLKKDDEDENSSKDFGKNVIPAMIADGANMFSYEFKGYWKDVGTIDALWESNMDLLDPNVALQLDDPPWKIYSRNRVLPPHYVGEGAKLVNSFVSEGCMIEGHVENSIIFPGVTIKSGAVIKNSILMPDAMVDENARVEYSILAEFSHIKENSSIGLEGMPLATAPGQSSRPPISVLGKGVTVDAGVSVEAGTIAGSDISGKEDMQK